MPDLRFWKKQLITHEDPGHFHKVLGVSCLLSIMWRFSMAGSKDMGFAVYPELTLPTLCLHLCLSASSFVFSIPQKRIKTGDRICKSIGYWSLYFLLLPLLNRTSANIFVASIAQPNPFEQGPSTGYTHLSFCVVVWPLWH